MLNMISKDIIWIHIKTKKLKSSTNNVFIPYGSDKGTQRLKLKIWWRYKQHNNSICLRSTGWCWTPEIRRMDWAPENRKRADQYINLSQSIL